MTRKILISFIFSLLIISSSYAACFKSSNNGIRIDSSPNSGCDITDSLTFYSNQNGDLNSLIAGGGDRGYSMHFKVDRDQESLSRDQILFSFYEDDDDLSAIAVAGIKASGEFFYVHGADSASNNGILVEIQNDDAFSDSHVIIIVYDQNREKLTVNIDGNESSISNISPIAVSKISKMEIGKDFSGIIDHFKTYATRISPNEREETIKILANK